MSGTVKELPAASTTNQLAPLPKGEPPTADPRLEPRVAYIMSRFPKLTETFILFEVLALKTMGVEIEIYPLLRARNTATHPEGASLWKKIFELFLRPAKNPVMHREVAAMMDQVHFAPLFNGAILWAQVCFLLTRPWTYLCTLARLVRANWGSSNYLLGGLAIFPKCVYLARRMKRDGIEQIHAHFANHPAAAAYTIHRLTGIPYSFTAHGADLQVDQHMLSEKVAAANFVVTISDYNKRFLLRHCGEEHRDRIVVLRCGVDTSIFHPPVAATRTPTARKFTLLLNGTFYEVKGHTYLIEACRLLRDRGVDLECLLIGDGPLRESLEQQVARVGLESCIRFLGRLTRDEIATNLRQADALVAPSVPTKCGRREGIPVVLMEAMATGLPVVASDISGISELVEHERNGLLVPPADPAALADAIERLASDEAACRRLGSAGRQRVRREFDLETNAAKLRQLFAEDV